MSGDEITKVGIWDDRLKPTTPSYAIQHGASSVTSQAFAALSASTSQHVYSINVPSLQTYVDRFVLWQSQVSFLFNIQYQAAVTLPQPSLATSTIADFTASGFLPVAASGVDFALAAYPLHRLTTSMLLSINDVSTTLNTAQVLPSLLRMLDVDDQREHVTTPTKLDVFASSAAARGAQAGPYSAFDQSNYGKGAPNGSYPFQYVVPQTAYGQATSLRYGTQTAFSFLVPIPSVNATTGLWSNTTTITTYPASTATGSQTSEFTKGYVLKATDTGYYLDTQYSATTPAVVIVVNGVPYMTPYIVTTLGAAATMTLQTIALQWNYQVGVQYVLTENLLTSPFTSGGPAATVDSAMFGINNFQLTCQMQTPSAARLFRQLDPPVSYTHLTLPTNREV